MQKKGTAAEQGLGRSRGGFTSKIVLTAADEDTASAVDVVPGQAHEASLLEAILDQTAARVPDREEVVGDKGFDGDGQRQACRDRGAKPVIPFKANRTLPGRLNKKAYRERNKIERLFARWKQFRRVATRDDQELSLTVREFDLLAFLMSHPGRAFRRSELLEMVWGWTFGDQSTVTVHVRRLREKIEKDPANPQRIVTVWGVGYRFESAERAGGRPTGAEGRLRA